MNVRYLWTIKTSNAPFSGTDGDVTLGLHGLRAATQSEVPIKGFFEKGGIDSGVIESKEDLGDIQTGTLRTTDTSGHWEIEYVKVQNLDDSREWLASEVGTCSPDGACPILRFEITNKGDQEAQTSDDSTAQDGGTGDQQSKDDGAGGTPTPDATPEDSKPVPDAALQQLQKQLAQQSEEIGRLRALLTPPTVPLESGPRPATLEIYGTVDGHLVPLHQAVNRQVANLRVFVADDPKDGFGLAGPRSLWDELFPNQLPHELGLEDDRPIVSSDGLRAWPVSSKFLFQLLGADWRSKVYP